MEIKLDYSDVSFKNNGRLKLLIIVGTRPEIIRLAAAETGAIVTAEEHSIIGGLGSAVSEYLSENYPTTGYGETGDVYFKNLTYSPAGAQFDVVYDGGEFHVSTKLLGKHFVSNITAAAAVALSLGVKPQDIAFAAAR